MPIAYDNATPGEVAGGASPIILSFSHTTGTLTNGVLLVGFGYFNRSQSASGVTYNGVAMTKRRRYDNGAAAATSEWWYLVNPPSGANNVVITTSGGGAGLSAVAISLSGVDQTTPIEADSGGNVVAGAHTTHSTTVNTATANAWVIDGLFGTVTTTPTPTSGQTLRAAEGILTDVYAVGTRGPIATPGSESAAWSFPSTSNASNMIALAVKAAVAGGSGGAYYRRRRSTTTAGRGL